ncbi:MAG: FAD-dependent oxidoreductase [Leptolyngbya foveolarum]|uniref:FAD-dependent oxidoreductase n=1 Tax=Leptolyngbya foveolarum TaxID=47253 RepID=A0A2W4VLK1_9CYAN|nr:MAG: FAD-dependent oxidoreductase [Leptolyngbya foveolarum]
MQTYDAIVIGNGIAGAALSYELAKAGQSVLLMDDGNPDSGTRYSYGGIGYWAGTTELTTKLFQEGFARHQELSDELGAETQLRELDLLLTVEKGADVDELTRAYGAFNTPPQFISAKEAGEIEPCLDADAIAGAFITRHAQIDPMSLVAAYNQAFRQLGGHHNLSAVTGLVKVGDRITGITTNAQAYPAGMTIVSAGAYSLQLLKSVGVKVPLYFTHAEIVETPKLNFEVRSLIMPATNARFEMESKAGNFDWEQTDSQIMPPILEAGVIQLADKTARIGQISRFYTGYESPVEGEESRKEMVRAIAQKLPELKNVSGTWRHCLVSFTQDGLPLIGPVPSVSGLHLFSGFTGPFALVPPVAQRYAQWIKDSSDPYIDQILVNRFLSE